MEGGTQPARKVMVVAESTRESSGALQYALTNVLTDKDELILVHVESMLSRKKSIVTFLRRPSLSSSSSFSASSGGGEASSSAGEVTFLEEMKNACGKAQPKVPVRLVRVQMQGNNKGDAILAQAEVHGVDLLLIGQRRTLSDVILRAKKPGGPKEGLKVMDTAEYLIANCKCNCVGVQKKGQNGGYLLNSKTHKNFWVLA